MKKCKRCGAILDNHHNFCLDCGEHLGKPLSKEEETKLNQEVTKKIKDLSNHADYFHVRKRDKLEAAALIIGAVAYLPIIIFGKQLDADFILFMTVVMISMVLGALNILFPKVSWSLFKLQFLLSIANPDDLQPSEFSLVLRRFLSVVFLVAGYGFLLFAVIQAI